MRPRSRVDDVSGSSKVAWGAKRPFQSPRPATSSARSTFRAQASQSMRSVAYDRPGSAVKMATITGASTALLEADDRVLGVERGTVDVLAGEVERVVRGREHRAHAAGVLDRQGLRGIEAELTQLGRHPLGPDEAGHEPDHRDVVRA